MELFDRVVVKEDFEITGFKTVKSETIGTIRKLTNELATIQIDCVDRKQILITVSKKILRNATVEDLNTIKTTEDCLKIVNPLFHPGNKYISFDNYIFIIRGIILAINEEYDLFHIEDKNGTKQVDRKFIDKASYFPFEEAKTFIDPEICQPQKVEIDEYKISINGFEFNIRENNVSLGIISKDKLEVYINALTKLNKLLKGLIE